LENQKELMKKFNNLRVTTEDIMWPKSWNDEEDLSGTKSISIKELPHNFKIVSGFGCWLQCHKDLVTNKVAAWAW